jgi:hypothetical protein
MPLPLLNIHGLLPDGIHSASEDELHFRFVAPFPGSVTRERIFENFRRYRVVVSGAGLSVTQWIDGSFVDATRRDPADIDVVNFCTSAHIRGLSAGARAQITPLLAAGKATIPHYSVHSLFVATYDYDEQPYWADFETRRKYWRDYFSLAMNYSGVVKETAPHRGRKGIVQMLLGDATLCPHLESSL